MSNVYQDITDKIIAQLQKGIIPWTKPWVCNNKILSHATGKPYSLLNRMLLERPGEYATFKQVQEAGGRVKKGAKGERIFFFKPTIIEHEVEKDGEIVKEQKNSFILRGYYVFHLDDTEGLKPKWIREEPCGTENKPDERAENIANAYLTRENIKLVFQEYDRAFYSPARDFIQIPPLKNFRSSNNYYGVLFHEITHSTGTKERLNRFVDGPQPFGSNDYSKEELVAEMGSAMMLAELGLETKTTHTNNAAYIQNWLQALKGDANLVVGAASKAEKAVRFILNQEAA